MRTPPCENSGEVSAHFGAGCTALLDWSLRELSGPMMATLAGAKKGSKGRRRAIQTRSSGEIDRL